MIKIDENNTYAVYEGLLGAKYVLNRNKLEVYIEYQPNNVILKIDRNIPIGYHGNNSSMKSNQVHMFTCNKWYSMNLNQLITFLLERYEQGKL